MKLLTTSKRSYLLDAGTEILHEQSNEWLSEIAFWYDEVAFLYSLVVKKTIKFVPLEAKGIIEKTEFELNNLTSGELDNLKLVVEKHEKLLSNIIEQRDHTIEEIYREKHYQLTREIEKMERRMKLLKKDVFNLVELVVQNENYTMS